MKSNKIKVFLSLIVATVFLAGCSDDEKLSEPNYVSFGKSNVQRFELLEGDASVSKTFEVYTTNKTNVDRTFTIAVNPTLTTASSSSFTVSGTVTVPANTNKGEFVITSGVAAAGKNIGLDLTAESGLAVGKSLVVNLVQVCSAAVKTVTLDIYTDRYGDEITWELYNSDFELIDSGGPFPQLAATGIGKNSKDLCLAPGDYTFVIMDNVYADGMCCTYGNGYYTIGIATPDGVDILVNGSGDFGAGAENPFTVE